MLNILIAEDDYQLSEGLSEIMQMEGHHVVMVEDGQQALEMLKSESFDLLLTDYAMPELDGEALVSFVQQNPELADMQIIVISGYDLRDLQTNPRISLLLRKPFDIMDILKMINSLAR
jgi:two-component system, OmpR family, response regulator VicR